MMKPDPSSRKHWQQLRHRQLDPLSINVQVYIVSMHLWTLGVSTVTGLVCTLLLERSKEEATEAVLQERMAHWKGATSSGMQTVYLCSQACYAAAFTVMLAMSLFADTVVWEVVVILPLLLACVGMLEFYSARVNMSRVRITLQIETMLLVLLAISSSLRHRTVWPLYILHIGAVYHVVISEETFYYCIDHADAAVV
jgi:hypothetical protein